MKVPYNILLISLLSLSSCGNRSRQEIDLSNLEEGWGEKIQKEVVDTIKVVKGKAPMEDHHAKSRVPNSILSSDYNSSDDNDEKEYDNMRGFDPASEDDMEDNGMSRYMENYDEEGWD